MDQKDKLATMHISHVSLASARNKVRWYILLDVIGSITAVCLWCMGYWWQGCFFWILSEFWNSNRTQCLLYASKYTQHDIAWTWCESCQSYHHPQNTTCKEKI